MSALTLHRIDPERNMKRFYRLDVQPDLFGLWIFIREWGRIGRAGQTHEVAFPSIEEAQIALERQRHAKQRRGYAHCFNNEEMMPIPALSSSQFQSEEEVCSRA